MDGGIRGIRKNPGSSKAANSHILMLCLVSLNLVFHLIFKGKPNLLLLEKLVFQLLLSMR